MYTLVKYTKGKKCERLYKIKSIDTRSTLNNKITIHFSLAKRHDFLTIILITMSVAAPPTHKQHSINK